MAGMGNAYCSLFFTVLQMINVEFAGNNMAKSWQNNAEGGVSTLVSTPCHRDPTVHRRKNEGCPKHPHLVTNQCKLLVVMITLMKRKHCPPVFVPNGPKRRLLDCLLAVLLSSDLSWLFPNSVGRYLASATRSTPCFWAQYR